MSKTRSSALKRDREQRKAEKIASKRRRKEERKAEPGEDPNACEVMDVDANADAAPESEPLSPQSISEPTPGSTQL